MPHTLFGIDTIDDEPRRFLESIGHVFAVFDHSAESGNVSYSINVDGAHYFVKTAGPKISASKLSREQRIFLLETAVAIGREIDHPSTPKLLHVIPNSPHGPMLIYDWMPGENLGVPREQRVDPASSYYRFRHLPASEILLALNSVYEVHDALAAMGWIAVDLYDGSLMYDFECRKVTIFDFDYYHRGPFTNTMGEMFGSSQFMAPEELTLGAPIDQHTTVFTLGRFSAVFLSNGSLDREPFRGSDAMFAVMVRACRPDPTERYDTVREFVSSWRAASLATAMSSR